MGGIDSVTLSRRGACAKLEWDAVNKRITSLAEGKPADLEAVNAQFNPPARAPWKLD